MSPVKKTKEELMEELQQPGIKVSQLLKEVDTLTRKNEILINDNEKLKAYFEHANDAILLFDGERFVDCNEKVLELFRCTREQILSIPPAEIWAEIQPDGEKTREYIFSGMKKSLNNECTYEPIMEWRNRRFDGTFFDSELSVSSMEINGKKYLLGILRDITERKRAEGEHKESESFFQAIFENSGTATLVSEEDMTISRINQEFEVLTGYAKEEVEGKKKWPEFVHPEDLEKMKQYHNLRRIDNRVVPRQYECRLITKDGFIRIVGLTVALFAGPKRSIASFMDLTERRKTEENLQESELKYRTLFESANDAILLLDSEAVVECNQKTLEMFRCTKEEVLKPWQRYQKNRTWPDRQPDGRDSREKYLEVLKTARKGDNGPFYWQHKRYDGTLFDTEVYFNFIMMKGKKYFQCIIRDISERKRAEELYQTMANTSNAGVFIIQDGRYKYVNPNAIRQTGYSLEELIGRESMSVVYPDDRKSTEKNAANMLRSGGSSTPFEFRIVTKNGSIRYLLATYAYVTYEGKKAILGNSMDITELKELRSRLDEIQILEDSILKTISHAVLGLHRDKIIFANPATERIFGWPVEDLLGKDVWILYRSEEDYLQSGKLIYSMLEKHLTCTLEVPCRHRDGHVFFCILNASAIDQDGRIVIVFEDVTDRKMAEEEKKKLEAQLIQSQKMEAVGTLAGGLAHDFNNLLMGIQGSASILMIDFQGDKDAYERLKSIEDLVQSGAHLTRQLLSFVRGGKYELKAININDLIEKAVSLFARTKKEIIIHRFFAADIPPVEVDRSQMEQMLLNLLVNAWQAMPQGGDIHLITEKVFLADDFVRSYSVSPGIYVKISIQDTGVGMDTKTKERIFEPFFTTKEMGRGTGLGLAMVYGIVRGHGGIITVTSNLNKGSQFDIYLPASGKEPEDETKADEKIVKGTETILLVDDEKVILDVSRDILGFLGYNVLIAHNGQEAIDIYSADKDKIDLVVQDMVMPGMSGVDTFYALKIINPAVKVVLSSGYVINQQIETVMEHGCRAFIQKPFRMEELSKTIREVLDSP